MMRACLLLVLLLGLSGPGTAAAEYALTLLHTNDVHARAAPIDRFNGPCTVQDNEAGACFGGAARMMTAIGAARAAAAARAVPTLLVDAGDQFQGSLFYTHYKGQLAADLMRRMGYDAMAAGNHEFDDGPAALRRFVDLVDFPVLLSNAEIAPGSLLDGVLPRSVIVERGGERLGLIGLAPQDTAQSSSPGPDIAFTDAARAVQREVDALTASGIDKIILLSHSGLGTDLELARATRGVDVIVGGHSHTLLSNEDPSAAGPYPIMVGETAIVQAYGYGKYLGELHLRFDGAGRIKQARGRPRLLDASVAEDPAMKARVTQAAAPLDAMRRKIVGRATAPVDGSAQNCRSGACAMGIAVAEAMLAHVRDQGVDVALHNGGGVRAGLPAGDITMGDVLTVLPFRNGLATFRISGAALRAALENGVSRAGRGAGRFPQVAGMRFSYVPGAPVGARVRDVTVGGLPLEDDRLYGVVSNSFLRGGGDGYTMLRDAQEAYDYGPDLADVLAAYLTAKNPFEPLVDDRIIALPE